MAVEFSHCKDSVMPSCLGSESSNFLDLMRQVNSSE